MTDSQLIDVDDCVLTVIDVQPCFLEKLPEAEAGILLERICWLVGVARWARVPLVVMAEDIEDNGGVHADIAAALPPGTPVHDKMRFGLAAEEHILRAVTDCGRKTAVLVGLETDVCVSHSALGLLAEGFRVAAVADATASPGPDHAYGLQRMRAAGVVVVGLKGLFYEWVRTVARCEQFHAECDASLPLPPGVRL